MSIKEINIALLSSISEDEQPQIFEYLIQIFSREYPFKPKSADEIYKELAESRHSYECGEYEDFDVALEVISKKIDMQNYN